MDATPTTEPARIEQLEESFAAMTSARAKACNSHEGEIFSYWATAVQVKAMVVVTRGVVHDSKSRGATVELDP